MSTANLLPLLNQLQLMEITLTNFMLETVLKLQSLTDMKVFLLIESPQKRRYCGSKNLMDAFQSEKGLLCSGDTDIAVRLDPTANALIESAPSSVGLFGSASDNIDQSLLENVTHGLAVDLPLSSEDALEAPSKNPPLSRKGGWNTKSHKGQYTHSMNVEREGPSKAKRKKMECSAANDNAALSFEKNQESCKEEREDSIKEMPVYEISDDEGDDSAPASFLMDDTNISSSPFIASIYSEGNDQANCTKTSIKYPYIEPLTFFSLLEGNDLEIQKYNMLMNTENPLALYQKGTMESKVLKSVCYSVGKNAALKCPYPLTAENKSALMSHWSHHCDMFVGQCVNAGLLVEKNAGNSILLDLIPKNSAVGYIRQRIRDGFPFRKLSKLSQTIK